MDKLQIFKNAEFGKVRVIKIENKSSVGIEFDYKILGINFTEEDLEQIS